MSFIGYCLVIISFSAGNNFYYVFFQIFILASHEVLYVQCNFQSKFSFHVLCKSAEVSV